jgi:hypothetical protein
MTLLHGVSWSLCISVRLWCNRSALACGRWELNSGHTACVTLISVYDRLSVVYKLLFVTLCSYTAQFSTLKADKVICITRVILEAEG